MIKPHLWEALLTAFMFGIFQAIMPLIGYFLSGSLGVFLSKSSHWVAFGLLGLIGVKIIIESLKDSAGEESKQNNFDFRELLTMSLATSIDALTVGIVFTAYNCNIIKAASCIGMITCVISFLGVMIGIKFGSKFRCKAETVGGIILIAIGLKILLKG